MAKKKSNVEAEETDRDEPESKREVVAEKAPDRTSIVVFVLLAIIVATGAVIVLLQPPKSAPELHSIVKDGVEYVFSNNIYDALNVPVFGKDEIYEKLVMPDEVWILYRGGDNASSLAVVTVDIVSKLQHYNSYSLGKMIVFNGYDLENQSANISASDLKGTLIELRGPLYANETSVSMSDGRVLVQGTTHKNLSLAADRLALLLFGEELEALGVKAGT